MYLYVCVGIFIYMYMHMYAFLAMSAQQLRYRASRPARVPFGRAAISTRTPKVCTKTFAQSPPNEHGSGEGLLVRLLLPSF